MSQSAADLLALKQQLGKKKEGASNVGEDLGDSKKKMMSCSLEDDPVVVTMNLMQNETYAVIEVEYANSLKAYFNEGVRNQKE